MSLHIRDAWQNNIYMTNSDTEHCNRNVRQVSLILDIRHSEYSGNLLFKFISRMSGQCPDYIRGAVTPLAMLPGRNRLPAAANGLYDVPRTTTMFRQQAFYVAGPRQWNELPSDIRQITDRAAFKRALKSHYFRLAYGVDH